MVEEADQLWEITEEGHAVVVRHLEGARAAYAGEIGDDDEGEDRDIAGLVILLLIAVVTGVCATYTLLSGDRCSRRWLEALLDFRELRTRELRRKPTSTSLGE